jgi:hypothetical protein
MAKQKAKYQFREKFDKYVCPGETITAKCGKFTVKARVVHDEDADAPWDNCDGHGPVSKWRRKDSKQPGERILHEDGGSCRFYDWQEAMKLAKKDGWGFLPHKLVIEKDSKEDKYPCGGRATAGPYTAYDVQDFNRAIHEVYQQHRATMTAGQYAEGAVKRDFEYLQAWCRDEWFYVGVVLDVYRGSVEVAERAASLWGIDANAGDDNDYLTEVANELLTESLDFASEAVARIVHELTA